SHRTERINALLTNNSAKLCPDCKQMRGAMASGKLTREVVNIEGGSISLVTSTDPRMVARIYEMAGIGAFLTQRIARAVQDESLKYNAYLSQQISEAYKQELMAHLQRAIGPAE